MKQFVLILAAFALSGCMEITNAIAPPYVPSPIRVYDATQFAADLAECSAAGANWSPTFSFGSLATKTFDGATSNTSLIPISPLVPLYGAAGGAASATSDGLDFASGEHANVYRNCLLEITHRDGSAIIADPRN